MPFKAPIQSKCCIRGFRVTGLALVVILRCDWPLCDLRFKSYEHFKSKIFLSRNLIYLTAKILRTVHWKCTSQIKTPAELRNFKLFTQIKSFKPICTPRKARRSQQTYHLNWMKLRWMVTSGWKRLKILSHKAGLKDKTSSKLVEFAPKTLNFIKMHGFLHFLLQPSNTFTQIYLP